MNHLWKYIAALGLLLTYILGMMSPIPNTSNHETIRNLYFHVPMWFAMMLFFTMGFYYSIRYLRNFSLVYDKMAVSFVSVGLLYGLLGIGTGMVWADIVWGTPWNNDPKQVGAAIAILGYLAYIVLRRNIVEISQRARISAIYNIFAYFILFPTIWILPRMSESLHPGSLNDEEVVLNPANLTNTMRAIFWLLAVPSWILIGCWIANLKFRLLKLTSPV